MARHPASPLLVAATCLLLAACSTVDPASPHPDLGDGPGSVATLETPREPQPLGVLAGGDPLPEATLAVLAVGDDAPTVDTASWRGTPTVVNFWATWCGFCVEEMPDIQAVADDLGDAVRFVGVDREDRESDAVAFVEAAEVTYDLVEDPDGDFFLAVQGRGMPTTLFVDADGVIRHRVAGPLDEERLRSLVAEHLGIGG